MLLNKKEGQATKNCSDILDLITNLATQQGIKKFIFLYAEEGKQEPFHEVSYVNHMSPTLASETLIELLTKIVKENNLELRCEKKIGKG